MDDNKKYFITVDGKEYEVPTLHFDEDGGAAAYADAYKGSTIRMRDKDEADYNVPLAEYDRAIAQGLHPFTMLRGEKKSNIPSNPSNIPVQSARSSQISQGNQGKSITKLPEGAILGEMPVQDEASALFSMSNTTVSERVNNAKVDIPNWEEEKKLDKEFKAKQVNSYDDIKENYYNRYSLTEEGQKEQENINNIAKDLSEYYTSEFYASPEYKKIISSSAITSDKDKALMALWQEKYAPQIEKSLTPYYTAYNDKIISRYGSVMNMAAQELQGKNSAASWDEIEKRINDANKGLKNNKDASSPTYQSQFDKIMGDRDREQRNEKRRQISAAQSMLNNSRKLIQAASDEKNGTFIGGVARGAMDEAFNLDNWTMGLKGLSDGMEVLRVCEKVDKGQNLSKEEQILMDAVVANSATEAYFRSQLGRGYKAGTVTGASLPFMVDMLTGTAAIRGATSSAAKGILKYVAKKYGQDKVKNTIAKGVTGFAKGVVDAGIHTASLGAARVGENYLTRNIGDVQVDFNDEAKPIYGGRTNQDKGASALAKSYISTGLETQSELAGEQFAPILKFVGKQIKRIPGVNKIPFDEMSDFFGKNASPSVQEVKKFANRAQFHGVLGEYAEEVYNNLGSVVIGDMTPEQLIDLDNNIDTFLGVGVMSAAFGAVGTGAYIRDKYKIEKEIKTFENKMNGVIDFDRLKSDLVKEDIEGARNFVKETLGDKNLTKEEKEDEIRYIANVLKEKAMTNAINEPSLDDIEDNKATIVSLYQTARAKVDALPAEITAMIDEGNIDGLDDKYKDIAVDYEASKQDYQNYLNIVDDKVKIAKEAARSDIEETINSDMGGVVTVNSHISSSPITIVKGKIEFNEDGNVMPSKSDETLYYVDDEGNRKPIHISNITSMSDMTDAESLIAEAETNAENEVRANEDAQIPQHPEIGMRVAVNGIEGVISRLDADGIIVSTADSDILASPEDIQPIERAENSIVEPIESNKKTEINPINEVATQEQESNMSIPYDDKGNPIYHKAPVDITVDDMLDGSLTPDEVDEYVTAYRKNAEKNYKRIENNPPKIGVGSKESFLKAKELWKSQVEEAKAIVEYWNNVKGEIEGRREMPGDATAKQIMEDFTPMSAEELAAQLLTSIKLIRSDYMRQTGYGKTEANKMFGLFASKEKGGVSLERAGELLELLDRENYADGSGYGLLLDHSDAKAGINAILEVLSQVRTRRGLTNYIKNAREAQAKREAQAERDYFEGIVQENYHMSLDDYEASQDSAIPLLKEKYKGVDYNELYSYFADQISNYENGERDSRIEGSVNILSGKEFVNTARDKESETIERLQGDNAESSIQDGIVQESTQGVESGEAGALPSEVIPFDKASIESIDDIQKEIVSEEGKVNSGNKQANDEKDTYTIEKRFNKKAGKFIYAVNFTERKDRETFFSLKKQVKEFNGYYSSFGKGGFIFDNENDAKKFAEAIAGPKELKHEEVEPKKIDVEGLFDSLNRTGKAKLSDNVIEQKETIEKSKFVADEDQNEFAQLKARLKNKMNQLNSGIDPELLEIGAKMTYLIVKNGTRKFAEYAKAMIEEVGDGIRPYLKQFYMATLVDGRLTDEMFNEMDSPTFVRNFDIANFDKKNIDVLATAKQVAAEQNIEKEVEKIRSNQDAIKAEEPKTKGKVSETKENSVSSQKTSGDLFGDLFNNVDSNNQKTNKDEGTREKSAREDRQSSDSVQARESVRTGTTDKSGLDSNLQDGRDDGRTDSGIQSGAREVRKGDARPIGRIQGLEKQNQNNNHAERGVDYAPKGVEQRIDANINAIELMQQLVESGKQATPAQMEVLRKFSGWGGLGKAFTDSTISTQLMQLLGDEAYEQANMSRNSAYYTPANVIDTLWDIVESLGFKGGNILEGSAGIGNIIGLMPSEISSQSNIHAVEIDGMTGNILSLLYPDANVEIKGFEETYIPNNSIDLAITNVPFVTGLRVNDTTGDKDLSKKFHDIHDFCIAKNIRKLREGGIGIFITSSGTLDNSKNLREWIINNGDSDVVGAFRLNNTTFGGTGATSDIIVVRKRVNGKKSPNAIDVLTTTGERVAEYDTGETKKVKGVITPIIKNLSMDYNKYFVEHPEMMGGVMMFGFENGDTFRPTSKALYPDKGKNQEQLLKAFADSFKNMKEEDAPVNIDNKIDVVYEELGKNVKEGSLLLDKSGKLCTAQLGKAVPLAVNANKVKGHTKEECFNAYVAIKGALRDVLDYQINNDNDKGLKPVLDKLNKAYDEFVKTYGHFNKNTSISFLKNDIEYSNISALETYKETNDNKGNRVQEFGKTDIFTKRVIEKEKEQTFDNVSDGIISSVYKFGRIDVPYISQHLGKTENEIKKEILESGLGFENPDNKQIEVSYKYLSGNVREKLQQAKSNNQNGEYNANIKALEKIIPMDIPSHLIDFTLGSSWINPQLYAEFLFDKTNIKAKFVNTGGTWFMRAPEYGLSNEKNIAMGVRSETLNIRIFGHTLIEAAIQNRSITVSKKYKKWDGTSETKTDKEATQACATKIDEIRQEFKEWARNKIQNDPELAQSVEKEYNDLFNNYVPSEIPNEFLPSHFGGAATSITLRPHQAKAVVKGTMQPLLLAHEVGTGKTFTLISIAMEMRRLGTANKPMIVVQNATVGQFVSSAKALYPNAKILTIEDGDRTAEGRKSFYAKIRYNDWDIVVVPQSVFEKIPDSEERQSEFVKDKIEEKLLVVEQMRDNDPSGKSFITRQAERELGNLQEELANLSQTISTKRKEKDEKKAAIRKQNAQVKALEMLDREVDDVENFDDMGIDAVLVDEAHEYKHLGFATAMQRGVKGVDPSYSKNSQGVFLKTQAVLEKNNGRNVIFATGTPISNTAAEIWTFMRYLLPKDVMKGYGIYYFDDFVRNFGNLQQMLEFTTSGKFKENNRFAGYVNIPELVRIWSGVADTMLTKDAEGVNDKIPNLEGDKAQDIYLPQTRALRSVMMYVKSRLAEYEKMSGKEKKEKKYIPVTMYGIAKAAAIDARLVLNEAEDDTNSKTNEAVRQTLRALEETKDYKGTIAIFADNYRNKHSGFNLYEDIRSKLIENGVPAEQIVIMKSGMSIKKKLEIFDKVNSGEIRVAMGSTFTLGTGVNIQERLNTLIHVDVPNRPMDYTQRNGRILRQGNLHKDWNKSVRILRFGVEDSLDVTAYQRLKTKGAIADSIMKGKDMMKNSMENRSLEEEEDVFGDTVAQLSGSEYAMLKNQAEKDARKYESKLKQYEADQTYIHNQKPRLIGFINMAKERIEENEKNLSTVEAVKDKTININGNKYNDLDAMGDFIKNFNKKLKEAEDHIRNSTMNEEQERKLTVSVGGIDFTVRTIMKREVERKNGVLNTVVRRVMTYNCVTLGLKDVPVKQMLLRNAIEDVLENVMTGNDFKERIESAKNSVYRNENDLKQISEREGKPFQFTEELKKAQERVEEYSRLMKKEMEDKEKKYAEMDANTKAAENVFLTEEEDSENEDSENEDETRFRDEDITQNEIFQSKIEERLGTKVRVINDVTEIVDDNIQRLERKRKAKGWYDPKSGEVVIVAPNIKNGADLQATILHEIVAHKGLKQMFGTAFNSLCDKVFDSLPKEIQDNLLSKYKDKTVAGDEYMASIAENGCDATIWEKIKGFVREMLGKIGIDMKMSDSDIKYLLWKSKNRLMNSDSEFEMITKIAKDKEIRDNLRFHDNDDVDTSDGSREAYNLAVQGVKFRAIESYQDSMLALKKLQEVIEKTSGKEIKSFENAYDAENKMSSISTNDARMYYKHFFEPMEKEIGKLISNGNEYTEIVNYVIAKHGIERNEYLQQKEEEKAGEPIEKKDYSGLTSLFEADSVEDSEQQAKDYVEEFEKKNDTAELWRRINAATKDSLDKSYQSGLISKDIYDNMSTMYEFYVPLRGWREETAADVYEYLQSEISSVNPVVKKAKGRRSVADDPFATIGNMAESTILQANRNVMKQKFLSMVINHPTDVAQVKKAWYVLNPVTELWELSVPDIDVEDNAEEIDRKFSEHEERMSLLQADGKAKMQSNNLNIDYKSTKWQKSEHMVVVKRNGKDYVILINGNPRAAQAINGLTNPDIEQNKFLGAIYATNRWMSANFTTRNPAFVLSNLSRDLIYAQTALAVKENPRYAAKFAYNIPKAMNIIRKSLAGGYNKDFETFLANGGETGYMSLTNVEDYKKKVASDLKKLSGNENKAKESLMFLANRLEDFNRWAENTSRFATYLTSIEMGKSVSEAVTDAKEVTVNFNKKGAGLKSYNARKAFYTPENLLVLSSGMFRAFYIFFNAGMQGLTNAYRITKKNPIRAVSALALITSNGLIMPLINSVLASLSGEGDDDKYWDLPDWVRRNNLCIYCGGGKFITIPLPIELRAFYGIGDAITSYAAGKSDSSDAIIGSLNQIMDMLPINPVGNGNDIVGNIMPSAFKPMWDVAANVDFTGKPVYKATAYNELDPEFKRVYKGTSGWLVDSSQFLNSITGGNDFKKGVIDFNPAKIEHLFQSYFGGVGTTLNQTMKTIYYGGKSIAKGKVDDDLLIRNVPVVNRFLNQIDDRNAFAGVNKEYNNLVDKFDIIDHEVNGLSKKASWLIPKYIEQFKDLTQTEDYRKYKKFEQLKKNIDNMYKFRNSIPDDDAQKKIDETIKQAKIAAIEEMGKW